MKAVNSEIIPYFKGKNVFLTGATGFVGKLIIDQLLRKCDVNKLYLLIRSKKGVEPKQRVVQLFQDVIYERLRNEKPNILDKIELLIGDLSLDNLGLNEESEAKITKNVNVVIHGGATVKFDEIMRVATAININGTKEMVKLAHKIKNLEAFVYISTAFSNCINLEIKEEFYKPPITCDELLNLVNTHNDKQLELMTPKLLGKWPNSYTFTKAIAEDVVNTYAKGLPVAVYRPAIIVGTDNEPVAGWIDNIYGPTGLLAGCAAGVVRVIKANPKASACIIPADKVARAIVAATYKTSLMGKTNEIPIYNHIAEPENPFTWDDYLSHSLTIGNIMPVEKSVWKHSCRIEPDPYLFTFYSFFLHFLPALLIDLVLLMSGKKRRALKAVDKVGKFMDVLSYFSMKSWKFSNNNIQALWSGLNSVDKEEFNFDMKSLEWYAYFQRAIPGIRLYIFNENETTIPKALKRRQRQELIQNIIVTFFYGIMACMIWKVVSSFITINT